ncbi:LacI family DNA-binding transcriptional regulator [Herbiconiux sp. KACC 21604]|uniref:LacI family DNA-binding transcriptional regulator n=1 Tax=unclassified Herbiconiux TaxID=2618217 RepID=UPI001491C39C|nr:LacI family DNA-binding transcriptional regulator [Herbiconiux sp. SALV-R1]QJU53105.1 LacI family DNA-binding transcriptional regulator [Herbiconiux sp. SALV-R1]WPO88044.1 LacI family DNA-binding transcriptional regulator [Herbiconiux sp. KACC 21604]
MPARPPTMKDVAAAAGVALKTVSRHVNGATNIDPVLAQRISDAIVSLGYRHNLAAASIRPGRSAKVVGLVISDLANPYWSVLARAVERVCSENGYLLVTVSSEEDGERHRLLVDRLIAQRVDGLIVAPPRRDDGAWAAAASAVVPIVAIDRPVAAAAAEPPVRDAAAAPGATLAASFVETVLADNAGGAENATRALLEGGARRILFLGDSIELYTMRERLVGYRRALEGWGDGVDGTDAAFVDTSAHTAVEAAAIVTALLGSDRIDAVFAANNRSAIGALDAFTHAGSRLPLVGFDDFEAAPLVRPAVSVVAQDVSLMGETAARAVLARLTGSAPTGSGTTVLPTTLVLRGSER